MFRSENTEPLNTGPLLQRQTTFDEFEERLVLSAQPLGDFFIDSTLLQDVQPSQMELSTATVRAHQATGVSYVHQQYGLSGAGQTVVVIDSGIAYDHVALGGGFGPDYRVVGGWDFTEENDADPYDDGPAGFHGTHVAGIIGSSSTVYPGVAPGVDLVALRVFNDQGAGYFTWVENALSWVAQNQNSFANPITTVNLSLGTAWNSDSIPGWATLEDELRQLNQQGIVVAVSAGNSFANYNSPGLSYPAASSYVIPVSSVDDAGNLSAFSQRNSRVLAAPGERIMSTVPNHIFGSNGNPNDWAAASGTSMASPYLAGASVLVRQAMEIAGRNGITQDTIYSHLRGTADSVYDALTSASYLRLNVQRAVDTLLGVDDYGSTPATAHRLGNIFGTSRIDGVVGSVKDVDYFTFTATGSGQVTMNWTATHELSPVVTLDGTVIHASPGTGHSFEIVAGRSYLIGMATDQGVGRYSLEFQGQQTAPPAAAPRDLGTVELRQEALAGGAGEDWFRVKATRTGYFTADAVATSGNSSAQVALFNVARQPAAGSVVSNQGARADVLVRAGDELLVRVTGASASDKLRVANLVAINGGTATVFGTNGNDTFEVQTGSTQQVRVNGLMYSFHATQFGRVEIDGRGGTDSATVRGTIGNETVNASPGQFELRAGNYVVASRNLQNVTFHSGGGMDQAVLRDSTANDVLEVDGASVRLSGPTFNNRLIGFSQVQVIADAGGSDRAILRDSIGNDRVDIGLGSVSMSTPGFSVQATGFNQVHAYATRGGFDRVFFHDSESDDTFTATASYASLAGGRFYSYAEGFDSVVAESTAGGHDRAYLYDTAGDDVLRATPASVTLTAAHVTYEARGFSQVIAHATAGGMDRAYLYDSAGNDSLVSRPHDLSLSGAGYSVRARGFEEAYAYAVNGGVDSATIHNAPASTRQTNGSMLAIRGDGYTHFVHGFNTLSHLTVAQQTTSPSLHVGQPFQAEQPSPTTAHPQATGFAAEQLFADATVRRLQVDERLNATVNAAAYGPRQILQEISSTAVCQFVDEQRNAGELQAERLVATAPRAVGTIAPGQSQVGRLAEQRLFDELARLDQWFEELATE